MKIHILYNFQQGPWGGGNQFLKALKKEFENQGLHEENSEKAEIILFNSHHNLNKVFKLKKKFLQKIFIHRVDGPIFLVRGGDKFLDEVIFQFNNLFADGTVFQSKWCQENCQKRGMKKNKYDTVIHNASDNDIFNENGKKEFNPKRKAKLIATSWSSNRRKGFEIYRFLDESLDFSKYEMTFVGNSSIEFKNIKWIKPVPSQKLAEILKQHDIYIFASKFEPCSNSLIEAICCKLPVVAINSASNPQLVKEGSELFNGKEDVIEKIEKVTQSYNHYQSKLPNFSIKEAAQDYYDFAKRIYEDIQAGKHKPKEVNFSTKFDFHKMKFMILKWKAKNKLQRIKRRIWQI